MVLKLLRIIVISLTVYISTLLVDAQTDSTLGVSYILSNQQRHRDINAMRDSVAVTMVEPLDDEHERRLLSCDDYQYRVTIRDDLFMYYVANPTTKSISIKLEYLGEAWISLGTNQDGRGAMIGSEAWMALPDIPVSNSNPGIYSMTSESVEGVRLSTVQMFQNGTISQIDGTTITTFTRKYKDFFLVNQPVLIEQPNEFVWAVGFSNAYNSRIHQRDGHFSLQIVECTTSKSEIEGIDLNTGNSCGFLRLSIFCPTTLCGFFGRLIGLC
jgi:hypothetical protein